LDWYARDNDADLWMSYKIVERYNPSPTPLNKILYPTLIDAGPANIKIQTAMALVMENAHKYPELGLGVYISDFGKLVYDLTNTRSPTSAELSI